MKNRGAKAQVDMRHAAWVCELAQDALEEARARSHDSTSYATRLFRAIYGLEDEPAEYPDRIADEMVRQRLEAAAERQYAVMKKREERERPLGLVP